MPVIELTPSQRREKRAEAHHLSPTVLVGNEGLTSAVIAETDAALNAHGLIKLRIFSDQRQERESILQRLTEELNAAPVQHIGKLLVIWRPVLPKEKEPDTQRMPGPKIVKVVKFSKSGNHRPQLKKVKVLGNMRIAAGGELKRAKKRTVSVKKKVPD
jgi:RNA-binding protein